eukprot:TRINITY_DN8382_c0_g1_i1.p1 TRINITY_DN8382_c0_g1~~TRINITY_DN8382_c0_g1_i1.p1  ORF type:complete len:286 (-),score=83.96 TRINITY_DN8382_c0_g1_i1:200-1057(-)
MGLLSVCREPAVSSRLLCDICHEEQRGNRAEDTVSILHLPNFDMFSPDGLGEKEITPSLAPTLPRLLSGATATEGTTRQKSADAPAANSASTSSGTGSSTEDLDGMSAPDGQGGFAAEDEDEALLRRLEAASRLAAEEERRQREEDQQFHQRRRARHEEEKAAKQQLQEQDSRRQEERLRSCEEQKEKDMLSAFLLVHGFSRSGKLVDDVNARKTRRSWMMKSTLHPLHVAAADKNVEVIKLLLDARAEHEQKSSGGLTALQLAVKKNKKGSHDQVISLLHGLAS